MTVTVILKGVLRKQFKDCIKNSKDYINTIIKPINSNRQQRQKKCDVIIEMQYKNKVKTLNK